MPMIVGSDESRGIRRVPLVCAQCGAEDCIKLFVDEPTPLVVNCWKCHAGYRVDGEQMLAERKGMFPVTDVPIAPAPEVAN